MNDVSSMLAAAAAEPAQTPGNTKMAAMLSGAVDEKQKAVAAAADAKRLALGGMPDDATIQRAAITRRTGAGLSSSNLIEQDLATLPYESFGSRFGNAGPELARKMLEAEHGYAGLTSGLRSSADMLSDSAKGAALGAADMVGGIAALGLSGLDAIGRRGGANTHMGVLAAEGVKAMNEAVEGSESPLLQHHRAATEQKSALQSRDNAAQAEQDRANGNSSLTAGLKEIGRNLVDNVGNTLSDPTMAMDAMSGAAGSLLGMGPISKGVGLAAEAGKKLLPYAVRTGMSGALTPGQELTRSIMAKLPSQEAAGTGLMFGGGSYQGTAAQIASMSPDDLAQLPPYQALITQGLSPDEARAQLADKAGQTAAVIAAPAGILAGKLAKNVIRNPLGSKTAQEGGENILASTTEQGLQGGAGQFANNVGIQQNVDPNQDLTAGVGEAAGSGMVGGLGVGAALQAPALAGHGLKAVGKAGADAFNARLNTIKAETVKASPISDEKMAAAGAAAQEIGTSEPAAHALKNMVDDAHSEDEAAPADTPKRGPAAESLANKIEALGQFDPAEIASSNLPDSVKEKVGDASHRVDMMQKLADVVKDKGTSSEEGLAAAFHLYGEISKFRAFTDDPAIQDIPKDAPAKGIVEAFAKLGANVGNSPKIMDAMNAVHNMSEEDVTRMVTKPADVAALASMAPDKPNLRTVQVILDGYDSGKIKLTADQHAALMASQAVLSASKKALDAKSASDLKLPINSVSKDIMSREGTKEDPKRSAASYAQRVFELVRAGNTDQAKKELSTFGDFVQHMSNKSDAANASYERGDGSKVKFEARNPDTGDTYQGIGLGVHGKNERSVSLAQQVNIEANQVKDVYNGLSKAFPQLEAGQHEVKSLHENLQGKPSDIAKAHSTGDLVSPRRETKLPEAKPEPEKEIKPEATPGAKPEATPKVSDEGASAKDSSKKEDKAEATPNIARGNVSGAEAKDTTPLASEHEKLSADMKAAGKSDTYNDPKVRKDLADRLDKLSDDEFVKVFEHSFDGRVVLSDPEAKSDKAIQTLMDQFTKQLGVKDADIFARMVKAYTETGNSDFTGKFYTDGPVIGIAAKDLSDFESGKVPVEYLRHILSHELSHAIDLHASENSLKNSHDDQRFDLNGDLYKEFSALRDAKIDKTSKPNFDYIEGQTNPKSQREEFFAELGAFVLSEPKLAKELIPNGTQAFHETVEQAKSNREPTTGTSDSRASKIGTEGNLRADERGATDTNTTDTGAEHSEPVAPTTTKEAYPDLVGTNDGKNWFHKAFTFAKDAPNRLVGLAEPYKALLSAISSDTGLKNLMGDDKRLAALPSGVSKAYKAYVSFLPKIADQMEAQLAAKLSKGTNIEKFLAGEANRWSDSRALNLVEQNPDGSFSYNRPLLEQSILAALQWGMVSDRFKSKMDADLVHALTGIDADKANGLVDMLDFGLSTTEAVQSLAEMLPAYWGVRTNNDEGVGHTKGIPLAVAAELLQALHELPGEQNLLKVTSFVVKGNTLEPYIEKAGAKKPRTVDRIQWNVLKPETDAEKANSVFAAPSLIEEAILKVAPNKNYYADETVPVADKQMNNPNVKNTPEQKTMIAKSQETKHFLDEHSFNLYDSLGSDNLMKLFGGGRTDADIAEALKDNRLNEQDALTLQGKNTTARSAWESVQNRISELNTLPDGLQTAIKYAFGISSIGRLQMLGGQTPQGSKLIRELILPTWATVDVRQKDGNQANRSFWDLALAQGLGIKVHQLSTDSWGKKLDDLLTNKFTKSIEQLQDHQKDAESFSINKLVNTLQSEFKTAGVDLTPVALKALTEHARWLNSTEEQRSNFKTSLYVEADGVTNGVVNALHMFSADHFSPEQIENYRRGGRFFNGTKTMNDYRQESKSNDLYTVASNHLQGLVDRLRGTLTGTQIQPQLDHMMRSLNTLAKGVSFNGETKNLIVDRGVTKNPMTITTYGSGLKGIAGNLTDIMVRNFYERLSKAAQAFADDPDMTAHEALLGKGAAPKDLEDFIGSLNALIMKNARETQTGWVLKNSGNGKRDKEWKPNKPINLNDLDAKGIKEFKFTPEQFNSIQNNLLHLFVKPMKKGIDTTVGDSLVRNTQLVQSASQAQTIVMEHVIKDRLAQLAAEKSKDPNWKITDGPSQNDIDRVIKEVTKQFPMLTPKGQTFFPVGRDMTGVQGAYSSAMSGRFESDVQIHIPSDGGVKALSTLNVGMGDGNMIQKGIVDHDMPNDSLKVFDGVNFGLHDVAEGSQKLNQAAYDAQGGNPIKAVLKSYEVFMKNVNTKMLDENPKMLKALSDSLDPGMRKSGESLSVSDALKALENKHQELIRSAEMVDIRHKVMDEFKSYSDNMAGAQSPYLHEGKSLEGMSSEEISKAFNKRVDELLNVKSSPEKELPPEQPTIADTARGVSGMANVSYGDDPRLSELNHTFNEMFTRFLKPNDPVTALEHQQALQNSIELKKMAEANGNGFQMSQQARDVFDHVVCALSLNTKLDPNAISGINELYQHVGEKLTPEMLENPNDPSQVSRENVAQTKYQMIMGQLGTKMDKEGRSALLSTFLGLALTDDGFRNALSKIDLPESKFNDAGTADSVVRNKANQVLDALTSKLSGQGDAKNVREALDNLTKRIGERALDARETQLEQTLALPNTAMNRANDAFTGWIEKTTDTIRDKAQSVRDATKNNAVKNSAEFVNMLAGLATEKNGALASEGIMSAINRVKGWEPIREMVSELVGRTKSNGSVYDMIKATNSMISKLRQEYRDNLPKIIAGEFSRKITDPEWSHIHQGMGKSDLAVLKDGRTNKRVLELLSDPRERRAEARTLETQIKDMDSKHFDLVQKKADQLAEHMMNGTYGNNLLMNAESVANLNGERVNPTKRNVTPAYVKAVDHLITLYALDKMSKETQKSLASLVQSESKGVEFSLNYLVGNRKDEVTKATGMAKYNALKGYTPTMRQEGASLIVASDKDSSKLLEKSYTRIGDYNGSDAEGNYESKGYYYAPVSGRAAFNQGIIQNAAHTSGGVEIGTGRSQGLTAGRITNPAIVDQITRNLRREGATTENLKAIYNDRGRAIAYERMLDPTRLTSVNEDAHLARSLGNWRGRQVEESLTEEFNKGLIDATKDMYDESVKKGNEKEYEDLFQSKDPIIRDAASLFTPETRAYARQVFGDSFMVRKDMLNDTTGYRQATVGDAWTGNSRWNQATQDAVKNLAMSVFGNKAYAHMVNAESFTKAVVKEAKTLIVVKSVIVPISNFTSNLFQLAARGVPITTMVRDMPRKVAEAETYSKGRLTLIRAEADLRAAQGSNDPASLTAQNRLKTKIQSINDSFTRLSIWPLIKAGEFSAISHSDMSNDDLKLVGRNLHDYMSTLVDKLPPGVQSAGKYALVTKDTALFQGLAKAVEYGDFLGKALQYDHWVNKKGFTPEQALARVTEEYVNFDRLPGRARGYLDSMGLMWFMNFKLRTTKVALSMIRENPVQALLGTMVPTHHYGVGTPFSDNIVAKAFSGHLGYSLGPGMILHAPMLNPVAHVLSKM